MMPGNLPRGCGAKTCRPWGGNDERNGFVKLPSLMMRELFCSQKKGALPPPPRFTPDKGRRSWTDLGPGRKE